MSYSFPNLEPVSFSMSSSSCCFLTHIQVFQETSNVVWYSCLFKTVFLWLIHKVKGFCIVNETNVLFFFWNSLSFSMIQQMLATSSLVPLPFLNPAYTSRYSQFTYCWSLAWRILSITLLACERVQWFASLNILWHCLFWDCWSGLPFPARVNHVLSELITMIHPSGWPCMAWLIASLSYISPFIMTRLWSMKVFSFYKWGK